MSTPDELRFTPLTATLGAEVAGIDLSRPLLEPPADLVEPNAQDAQ